MSSVIESRVSGLPAHLGLPPLPGPFDAHEYFKTQPGLWAHPSFLTRVVARVEGCVAGEHSRWLSRYSVPDLLISKDGDAPFLKNREIEDLLPVAHLFAASEVCRVVKQVKDADLVLTKGTYQLFLRDSFAYLFWSEDGPLGRWCVTSLERAGNENMMTRVDFVLVPEM